MSDAPHIKGFARNEAKPFCVIKNYSLPLLTHLNNVNYGDIIAT